jgi:hypothetical protein
VQVEFFRLFESTYAMCHRSLSILTAAVLAMNSQSLVSRAQPPHERNICNIINIFFDKSLVSYGGINYLSVDNAAWKFQCYSLGNVEFHDFITNYISISC